MLWGLFFSPFLLAQEHFSGGDLTGQFYAFARFQFETLTQGHLPLWSPGSFAGFPFAADTQAAVFYPPRYLTLLLSWPFDFPYYALELEIMIHAWLAGVFTYGLGYALTRNRGAGLVTAVAFALGGFLASYPLSQAAILEAYTWLPLSLLLIRHAVAQSRPRPWLLAAVLPLSLSLLAGHPQSFLHISYLAAAYYFFMARRARWSWADILRQGGVLAMITIGIGTAAWLPAVRFVARSVRGNVGYEFVAAGLPMLDYVHLFAPAALGQMAPVYGGLVTLVFAFTAWMGRRRKPEILFWGVVLFLSGWLALGDRGILFRLVYRLAPGFSLFRQQERLLGVFSLSLALLAGQGVAIWMQREVGNGRFLRRAALLLGGGLGMTLLILLAATPAYGTGWLSPWIRQVSLAALLLVLLWGAERWLNMRPTGVAATMGLLLLLLTADLFLLSQTAIERAAGSPDRYWRRPAWAAALPTDGPYRLDSGGVYFANVGELFGVEDMRGISPLKPQVLADLEALPLTQRWRLLNVVYALDPPPAADQLLSRITTSTTGGPALYRFEEALPRAWMVYDVLAAPEATAALNAMQHPGFSPADTAVLHPPLPPDLETLAPPAAAPTVAVTRHSPRRLSIDVTTTTPGLLVISEWAYPGWTATRNGVPIDLWTADYALQGIMLPAGRHQITLRYAPWDVPAGLVASLVMLFLGVLIAYRGRRWQPIWRPSRETAVPLPSLTWPRALRRPRLWLLVGLLLMGFGLRIFNLGGQELRGDEAFSYLFALPPAAEIIPNLLSEGDPHSPFLYLLLHDWMALAGDSEFALRFPSLLAGVLTLPLLYQVGRCLDRRRKRALIGVLALGAATLSPGHIWLAQDVRGQYTFALLFSTLALWLLVRRPILQLTRREWVLYALAAALAVYSHYYSVLALLAHGLYLLSRPERRRGVSRWLMSGAAALLLFLPWLAAMWTRLLVAGQLNDPGAPQLATYLTTVGVELAVGPSLPDATAHWLFLGALMLVGSGFIWLRRRQAGWAALLGGWLGGAALLIYLMQFTRATFNPFYISVALPAWWLLLATGAARIPCRRRWIIFLGETAVILAISGGVLFSLSNYFTDPAYTRTLGYRSVAEQVTTQARPGDLFLAHFPDPALDYYLRHVDLPRTMQPARPDVETADTVAKLTALADEYRRIWFVPYHHSVWDPEDLVPQWLDFNTLQESHTQHDRLTLHAYRPLDDVDAVITSHAAQLGRKIRLHGYYLTHNGRPVDSQAELVIAPGDRLAVTLVWEALAPIIERYTVFVHLLGENGALIVQHDGIPAQGTRPTPTWTAGERLLDRHELTAPATLPTEMGRLVMGVYESDTVVRQSFADGSDVVVLSEFSFAR